MAEINAKVYQCEQCGKQSLNKDDFLECIGCGKKVCYNVRGCSYRISCEVEHTIPNGIPFTYTKQDYVICHSIGSKSGCIEHEKPVPKELIQILRPSLPHRFYRYDREKEDYVVVR